LLTDKQTDKQTNNDDYISSLAEVIRKLKRTVFCKINTIQQQLKIIHTTVHIWETNGKNSWYVRSYQL